MSNIRKNVNKIFDLNIVGRGYWDFYLAMENIQCLSCDDVVSGDTIATFPFDNISGMCSEVTWEGATSFNDDLCDIGLTGCDNRFVDSITGETFNPSGDTRFCVKRVSGDTYCYDMQFVPQSENGPRCVRFCGGFFQGFYKLHEYEYEVLPNFYKDGWTKEFWLRKEQCPSGDIITITGDSTPIGETGFTEIWELEMVTGGTCPSGYTLNDVYPNNKGIFYFWGLRAENKFCNLYDPELELETCTGVPLAPDYQVTEFEPDINPFLYYTRRQACEPEPNPTGELMDCCDCQADNAMAFRITDEGEIGLRILTTTGECACVDDVVKFSGTPIIEEYYSNPEIIEMDKWHHVVFRFTPNSTNECEANRVGGKGVLSVFVDGYLKLKIDGFQDFIPYALDEHRDKQLGVPFNISLGGGTQGLLEVCSFDGVDEGLPTSGYTVCDYVTSLVEPNVFHGISINGVEYQSPPLTIDEPELIQMWLEMTPLRRQGDIVVTPSQFCNRKSLKIEFNSVLDTIDYLIIQGGARLNLCRLRCVDILPHEGACGILEDNFAGFFEGCMGEYRLHDRPLCLSEIRCNFEQEKAKYNRGRDIPKCKRT